MKINHVFLFLIFICGSVSEASGQQIRIINYQDEIDLHHLEEHPVYLQNVSIVDLQTRERVFLGDVKNGVIEMNKIYPEGSVIYYQDKGSKDSKRYFLPAFERTLLLGIPFTENPECVYYVNYDNYDAMTGEGDLQFGTECLDYTYILLDYCERSPTVTYPGVVKGAIYQDYTLFMNAFIAESAVYEEEYCDEDTVFSICDEPAAIQDEAAFMEMLHLDQLRGKKGTFSVRFGLNCAGRIVNVSIFHNNTNASNNELSNIFSNQLKFTPAYHRDYAVDSYFARKFRIRNDWIKIMD